MPHLFSSSVHRSSSTVSTGVKGTILVLVVVNLVQLNLIFLGSKSSGVACYFRGRNADVSAPSADAVPQIQEGSSQDRLQSALPPARCAITSASVKHMC